MNLYEKNYEFSSQKNKSDKLIALISDVHFCNTVPEKTLVSLGKRLLEVKPDVIFFTGDLVDDARKITESKVHYDLILQWVHIISHIAPVFIVKGNHDLFTKDEQNKGWQYFNNEVLFSTIANMDNVTLLSGDINISTFQDWVITGFDLGVDNETYYERKKESLGYATILVKPKINAIERSLDPNQFNVLLFHSPKNIYPLIDDTFSLVMSGHIHNGALPNFMDKAILGNRGILSPQAQIMPPKYLFPKYARGSVQIKEGVNAVIASPVTVSPSHNENALVRKLYKPGIQFVKIKSESR